MAVAFVEAEFVTVVKLFVAAPIEMPLLTNPIPPISNSLGIAVVLVVPVEAVVEFPVEFAVRSSGLTVNTSSYSITTAADLKLAWLIVMLVAASETLEAYQISVVEPPELVPSTAFTQVAPV